MLPSLSQFPQSHTYTETARGRQDTRIKHRGVGQRAAWQEGLVPNTRCRRAQGGDSRLSPHPHHCAIMRPYLEHSRPLFFSRSMRKFLSLVVGKVTSACCLLSRPVSWSHGLWRHSEADGRPLGQTKVRGHSGIRAARGGSLPVEKGAIYPGCGPAVLLGGQPASYQGFAHRVLWRKDTAPPERPA